MLFDRFLSLEEARQLADHLQAEEDAEEEEEKNGWTYRVVEYENGLARIEVRDEVGELLTTSYHPV